MKYLGKIKQDGCTVVTCEGELEQVWSEIGHYLSLYIEDGPIDKVEIKRMKNND